MVDIRQSPEYAKYLTTLGWNVERIGGINYFIRKFSILGSVLKLQRPENLDFEVIDVLCRKYRVFQIVIEPENNKQAELVKENGYKLSKSPYLPSKTLVLDLKQSKEKIQRQMKKDARNSIKKSGGVNIREVRSTKDVKYFYNAWKASVGFKRFVPPVNQLLNLRKSFAQNPALFLTSHNDDDKIIGGSIFTRSYNISSRYGGICYYWQAFTSPEGRTSLSQYSLLWKGILWAKSNKCSLFDFEGIYDPRFPNKSWLGFTHFKKSFGGKEIQYPGAFTKLKLPL